MAEENSEREIAALRNRISSLMKENKELRCEKNLEVEVLRPIFFGSIVFFAYRFFQKLKTISVLTNSMRCYRAVEAICK